MKIRGNFLGAAIVAIIYTVFILINFSNIQKSTNIIALIILNALTIILMYFAFKERPEFTFPTKHKK